jgi:hypothetical protein
LRGCSPVEGCTSMPANNKLPLVRFSLPVIVHPTRTRPAERNFDRLERQSTPRGRRDGEATASLLAEVARPHAEEASLLPPLSGPTQAGTTPSLTFRAMIETDEVEMNIALQSGEQRSTMRMTPSEELAADQRGRSSTQLFLLPAHHASPSTRAFSHELRNAPCGSSRSTRRTKSGRRS